MSTSTPDGVRVSSPGFALDTSFFLDLQSERSTVGIGLYKVIAGFDFFFCTDVSSDFESKPSPYASRYALFIGLAKRLAIFLAPVPPFDSSLPSTDIIWSRRLSLQKILSSFCSSNNSSRRPLHGDCARSPPCASSDIPLSV